MIEKTGKKSQKNGFKKHLIIFIWHGFFLALTLAMLDFNTVFPSLITDLIDSKVTFGILYSIMLGAPLIFNIIFSHFVQYYQYKRKFLLIGIYLRGLSFLGMAFFTYLFGRENPIIVLISFFFLIFLFSISGGFAGLAYTDIIGKLFGKGERGRVYAIKQFASSLAAFLGGLIVVRVFSLSGVEFPVNYSLTLLIGFIGLFIAAIAFWFIEEPPSAVEKEEREPLGSFLKKIQAILKRDKRFFRFIMIENMASFSLMVLPFYMVFARDNFGIDESYIGRYLLFQIGGTILSNLFWGFISDSFGSKWVVRTCILLGGFIPVIAILISGMGPDFYVLVFILIGFIISGRRVGFDPYLLDIAPDEQRTVYLGIRGTLNLLVVILPVIGGLFIDMLGYYFTFILVSLVMILTFILMGRRIEEEVIDICQ